MTLSLVVRKAVLRPLAVLECVGTDAFSLQSTSPQWRKICATACAPSPAAEVSQGATSPSECPRHDVILVHTRAKMERLPSDDRKSHSAVKPDRPPRL